MPKRKKSCYTCQFAETSVKPRDDPYTFNDLVNCDLICKLHQKVIPFEASKEKSCGNFVEHNPNVSIEDKLAEIRRNKAASIWRTISLISLVFLILSIVALLLALHFL